MTLSSKDGILHLRGGGAVCVKRLRNTFLSEGREEGPAPGSGCIDLEPGRGETGWAVTRI